MNPTHGTQTTARTDIPHMPTNYREERCRFLGGPYESVISNPSEPTSGGLEHNKPRTPMVLASPAMEPGEYFTNVLSSVSVV